MEILIKGQPQEISIYTVSLSSDIDAATVHAFHCMNCGQIIHQYQGRVVKIYPIVEPSSEILTITRCRKCSANLTFQTHKEYKNEIIRVVLHHQGMTESHFHCISDFADPLLTFNEKTIYSHPDHMVKTPPFTVKCPYPGCTKAYYIADKV